MLKKIPLSELVPGMYVQQLGKASTILQIKNAGWVKSHATIETMAKQGITHVFIDPDKTRLPEEPAEPEAAEVEPEQPIDPFYAPSVPVSVELEQAVELYSEAKDYQQKALDDAAAGRPIDVEAMQQITQGFLDSIFRNHEALGMLCRIRERDAYLLEHSINVSILLGIFGKYLKLSEQEIYEACLGGIMHDLGKIRVPEEVLDKPGRLTDQEFEQIKRHPLHGRDIIKESQAKIPDTSFSIVLHHHEKLNGKGYPFGRMDSEISKLDRMASICDIYDALTADRVYKKGMLPSTALSIIQSLTPDELDQELVYRFIRCFTPYPLGTMVRLNNDTLAIVNGHNRDAPTKPRVNVFYHAQERRHLEPEEINLVEAGDEVQIAAAEKPEKYGLNLANYIA